MSSMVFVTQLLDRDDPVLGFVTAQIEALSERVDNLAVVANEVRTGGAVSAEIISLGKERGYGRARRAIRYGRAIARLTHRQRPVTVLVHMCPVYVNLAAPGVKAFGARTMLWFAHPANSRTLAVAERLADAVLTTLPGSYPGRREAVHVVGQAIDTERFRPPDTPLPSAPLRLLAVGRTSPVKNYTTIIRAVAIARKNGADVTLDILAPSVTRSERVHREELRALIATLGVDGAVRLEAAVPHHSVPARLRSANALVNATQAGSADKGVFEAMASGRPALCSNPVIGPLLSGVGFELRFPAGDAEALATRIQALGMATPEVLATIGRELRARVVRDHSLSHWADTVAALSRELHAGGGSK